MMRSPITNSPAQVHKSLTTGALTPHEAAVRLARLEFDVARLEREIESCDRRADKARRTLARHIADRKTLLGVIARDPKPSKQKKKTNAA